MDGDQSGKYSKESLREAVKLILNEGVTVSQAVEKYGSIPRRTLQHHVKYELLINGCNKYMGQGNDFRHVFQCFC